MLKKLLKNAIKIITFIITVPIISFYSCSLYRTHNSDPKYASEVFYGNLPYKEVLESRKYHPFGQLNWDCTFAIVLLSEAAPQKPPTFQAGNWRYKFGGRWEATPIAELNENTRNATDFCGQYFSEATNDKIKRTLKEPGSWYIRSPVGETVFIYSYKEKLAARIRFGD